MEKVFLLIAVLFSAAISKDVDVARKKPHQETLVTMDCDFATLSFLGSPGACNDNGTPNNPNDDFFTQSVSASFFNRPLTGSLQIVPGGDQIGTYSILVSSIVGNAHIFNNVQFKADGTPTVIQMNFTDDPACSRSATGPTVQPCSTPPPACDFSTLSFLGTPSACNDNGTPNNPNDDFFTQSVSASFFNRPLTGSLQIVPGGDQIGTYSILVSSIVGNAHIFSNVQFKADGTPTVIQMNFTDDPACSRSATGPTIQPCSSAAGCSITSVVVSNAGTCNNNGTSSAADDFFTADVIVNFTNPPATGDLRIESGGDALPGGGATSVPVGSLVGTSHTFTGVRFKADGTITVVEVEFSADNTCVRTATGPTVSSCSAALACNISSVTINNIGACNSNGNTDPSDDFFTADVNVNFMNPPATGDLRIEPGGDALPGGGATSVPVGSLVGNSHTFTGVRFKADGTITVVEVEFSADNTCVRTATGPTVGSCCDLNITNVTVVPENCPNANNGSITVTASTSAGPLTYAISGPVNQSNSTGMFSGLPDGNYAITVTDNGAFNCVRTSAAVVAPGVDNIPPVPVCRNTTVTLDSTGNYILTPADVFNQGASSDNCGTVNFVSASPAAVGCGQVGQTIPVTVSVNDGNGNTASCTAQITVQEGTTLPAGFSGANVGNANGTGIFQPCSGQKFTLTASGFSSLSADVLHLVSRQLCGNGEIIAHVANVSGGGWAGIALRETTAPGSKKVALKTQFSNNIRREIRTATNGAVNNLNFFRPQDTWLRLVRSGNNFSGYSSLDGVNWNFAFSSTISMANCIRVGLFAESINVNTTTTAVFDQVSVTGSLIPMMSAAGESVVETAAPDFQAYPNPTTGEFTLDLSAYNGHSIRVEISNLLGETLKVLEISPENEKVKRLYLSTFSSGIYLIRVSSEGLPDVSKRVALQK